MRGERLQGAHGVADGPASGRRRIALEFDEEQDVGTLGQARPRVAGPRQEGAVEELHRRRVQRHEIVHRRAQGFETREPQRRSGDVRRKRRKPPLDRGDEGERPLGADE